MKIVLMTIDFHLPGCHSLKDKRHTLKGLKDRFGKKPNIAVCESQFHDVHDRAQWSFIAVSGSSQIITKMLAEIEAYADEELDAVIVGVNRDEL